MEDSLSLRVIVRNNERIRLHHVRPGDIITVYENENDATWNKGTVWEVTGDPTVSYPDGVWGVDVKPYSGE